MRPLPGPKELDDISRVVHEAVRAFAVTLGDKSDLPWDSCPDLIKGKVKKEVLFFIQNFNQPQVEYHELGHKDRLRYNVVKSLLPMFGWVGL